MARDANGRRPANAPARRIDTGSAVPIAPVERLDVPQVGGIDRAEGVRIDRPLGLVLGVAVAMLFQKAVEELEELPGGAEVPEGVLEGVVGDGLLDELAEA